MNKRMRIGEFARRVGMSVKTLRFYADQGVLVPAEIDPASGYRFYRAEQLRHAREVQNLRLIGLSLAEIRGLKQAMSTANSVSAALDRQHRKLEDERSRTEQRLAVLDLLRHINAHAGGLSDFAFDVVEPESVWTTTVASDRSDIASVFDALEREVSDVQGRAKRAPFVESTSITRTVCVPLTDAGARRLGAQRRGCYSLAARILHIGPYTDLQKKEHEVRNRLNQLGVASGSSRRLYHRFGASQDGYVLPKPMIVSTAAEYVTESQIFIDRLPNSFEGRYV
ncbi:MAG: MerR family transcriptional regulator [Myxococcota bacterium]